MKRSAYFERTEMSDQISAPWFAPLTRTFLRVRSDSLRHRTTWQTHRRAIAPSAASVAQIKPPLMFF